VWDWVHVLQNNVPAKELFPVLDKDDFCNMVLRVPMTLSSPVSVVLRRRRRTHSRPHCERGHLLQPVTSSWLGRAASCDICGDETTVGRKSCIPCQFSICATCEEGGEALRGGGAFTDILTPDLAEELLRNCKWLRYMCMVYFHKADYTLDKVLDKQELRWAADRMGAELGLGMLSPSEIDALAGLDDFEEIEPAHFHQFFCRMLLRAVPGHGCPPYIPFSKSRIFSI